MKNVVSIFLVLILAAGFTFAGDGNKYGEKITIKETTNISNILESPEDYVGKTVLIEGTVTNVCTDAGCWIDVEGTEGKTIRVKVEDGVIVFPVEEKGKTAKVQGVVYGMEVELDEEHSAEEHSDKETKSCADECSSPCTEKKDKKTKTVYMLKGIGAEIG